MTVCFLEGVYFIFPYFLIMHPFFYQSAPNLYTIFQCLCINHNIWIMEVRELILDPSERDNYIFKLEKQEKIYTFSKHIFSLYKDTKGFTYFHFFYGIFRFVFQRRNFMPAHSVSSLSTANGADENIKRTKL